MMGKRILAVLFGMVLLFTGMVICVKPSCARVIHEAFLGRAVALRANDAIWEWYSDMDDDLDWAVELQEKVTDHRQLDKIAAKYLDALADYYQVEEHQLEGIFEDPEINENLDALNQDIMKILDAKYGNILDEAEREQFAGDLYEAEYPVIEILNELPGIIRNFGGPGWMALGIYSFLTSPVLLLVLLLLLAALGAWMYFTEKQKTELLRRGAIVFLVDGAILGIILPVFIRSVSLTVMNRVVGRAGMIDTFAFLRVGVIYILIGGVLLLVGLRQVKKNG